MRDESLKSFRLHFTCAIFFISIFSFSIEKHFYTFLFIFDGWRGEKFCCNNPDYKFYNIVTACSYSICLNIDGQTSFFWIILCCKAATFNICFNFFPRVIDFYSLMFLSHVIFRLAFSFLLFIPSMLSVHHQIFSRSRICTN